MEEPARAKGIRLPRQLGTVLRLFFGAAGVVFLVVAFRNTWRRSEGLPIPRAWAFASAALLVLAGLFCLARAWGRLLGGRPSDRTLAAGFYLSQLGKYIPGAVWQALAQVGFATEAGFSVPQSSTAFGVHAVVEVAAGGTVGATLSIVGSGLPVATRLPAVLALLPLLLLRRGWLVRALHVLGRLTHRTFADALVPSQRAILVSYGWTTLTLVANAVAFALLLSSLPGGAPFMASSAGFGLAWTIGFLALPFPSGIGIREAVLLVTIGFEVSRTHLLAAAIAYRVVVMAAELVVVATSRIRLKARPPQEPSHDHISPPGA